MIRRLVALSLVACGSGSRAPEPARPSTPSVTTPTSAVTTAPESSMRALGEIAEAPHGGAIRLLAMSPDGAAVLSADELGGIRLWPALDGTQEPRIVDMPRPTQLAVGRRAGGYTAVARDEAGGLYIAKLDRAGRQLAHATLPAEPAIAWVGMTDLGVLAWRSDQKLLLLDDDGAARDALAAEPRQRIVALAVSGRRAVALIERDGATRQARWLALEPKLTWGPWIALDGELRGHVELALAPNGKRLAATVRGDRTTTASVFELAKGKRVAGGDIPTVNADLGFVDDDRVALGGFEGLWWIDLAAADAKPTDKAPISPGTRTQPALGTGGGHAVTAHHGELALWTLNGGAQYLGYASVSPRIAEIGPDGRMVIGIGDHILLLDRDLRVEATPFSGLTGAFAQLRWLGDFDWLLESSTPSDGKMQLALLGTAGAPTIVREKLEQVQVLHYEASSQLVTLSLGPNPEVARFDRKARTLERVASVPKASPYEQVLLVPVAPALAGGTALVQITMRERTTVEWLREPTALDKAAASMTVDGTFAGADAAGHVYMWRTTPAARLELVVYKDGKALRTLPNSGAVALWPEPTGKGYVEVTPTSVALYDIAGKQRWFQQLATSQEALWLTDGALAITSAGGVARLDATTGAVTAARCGWRFGLSPKPHSPTPRVEPLCAQLRR